MKVTEKTIQAVLMEWAMSNKHECVVPNTRQVFSWEADLLSITKAGLIHEYEIKVSRADFRADAHKTRKHWLVQNASGPSYFWYATFDGFEIEPPSYAGWLRIIERENMPGNFLVRVMKSAPRLHTDKITPRRQAQVMRSLTWRLVNLYRLNQITRPLNGKEPYVEVAEEDLVHLCATCGGKLEAVRPGKFQCPNCEGETNP